jgi:hypothetical protein
MFILCNNSALRTQSPYIAIFANQNLRMEVACRKHLERGHHPYEVGVNSDEFAGEDFSGPVREVSEQEGDTLSKQWTSFYPVYDIYERCIFK